MVVKALQQKRLANSVRSHASPAPKLLRAGMILRAMPGSPLRTLWHPRTELCRCAGQPCAKGLWRNDLKANLARSTELLFIVAASPISRLSVRATHSNKMPKVNLLIDRTSFLTWGLIIPFAP